MKNTAKINELVEDKGLLRHYRNEIASLKTELAKALASERTLVRWVGTLCILSYYENCYLFYREVPGSGEEEKRRMAQDNEAMAKRMAELEVTRASLESKISHLVL